MDILVISTAPLILNEGKFKAYAPYAKEMNIWNKYSDKILFCCPVWEKERGLLVSTFNFSIINPIKLLEFDLKNKKNLYKVPFIVFNNFIKIVRAMRNADHIHLRCPGNIGLLGCIVQVLFPNKPKTIKYAGNWDSISKQPISYRLQKWMLSNTFLTRNAKVLVYGEWPKQTKNIVPFFTATYSERECHSEQREAISSITSTTPNSNKINFIYVGGLTSGKQPLLSVKVIHRLKEKGYNVQLQMYGEGIERANIEKYVETYQLKQTVYLHGNATKEIVKKAYQKSHFLLFISKSEGWPKVVAEAMFWGCIPITSKVSCIAWMLGDGKRGLLVNSDIEVIITVIKKLLKDKKRYCQMSMKAQKWSQQYTLETFEKEIKKLLY